jgi:type VI secretion system protein ImpE
MKAEELLKTGDLDGALAALQEAIRADAGNARLRIFLFQLLAVRGDWRRAIQQLKVSAEMDSEAVPMAQTYREGIVCEVYREKVFSGEKDPLLFGDPQEWMALMVEALKAQAAGRAEQAADVRAKAFDAAPTTSGKINGEPFEWIADADMRLGPLLEVIINGKYYWMPFTAVTQIMFEPPADLRDAVWTPCTLTFTNGGDTVGLIPTRYAGTLEKGGPTEKLARATEFVDLGHDTFAGVGQRLLATDQGDHGLMDARLIEFDNEVTAAPAEEVAEEDG